MENTYNNEERDCSIGGDVLYVGSVVESRMEMHMWLRPMPTVPITELSVSFVFP